MADGGLRGVLISDFTLSNLAGCLAHDSQPPAVTPSIAPFGSPIPALLDPDHESWRTDPSFAVVWTRPEAVIESYHRALTGYPVPLEAALREVEAYGGLLQRVAERRQAVFVPIW